MSTLHAEHFTKALLAMLDETFDSVRGYYLDRGTSMFETLATITAAEASIPVGGQCATLAAQVKHVAFYLDVLEQSVRDANFPQVDWGEIWRTVTTVTPDEWQTIQNELRTSYERIQMLIKMNPAWPNEAVIGGALGTVVHTAYHLGEIRQALCIIRAKA